ncbi:MAG: DUF1295 domain-containing protein [Caulobacteraceae bacterium]|nr:DUF1295 domain-containing protein [Caulobacteraceae bacterium]
MTTAIFAAMSILVAAAWAFQHARRNGGWSDVCRALAMGVVGAIASLAPPFTAPGGGMGLRQLLVASLIGAWALRLGLHLRARVLSRPEDARYGELRAGWGRRPAVMMFLFLQAEGLAGAAVLVSVASAAHNPAPDLSASDLAGSAVLALGLLGESLADTQLAAFAHDPRRKGQVCEAGLWRWSRHPNYFFEWFGWLAYPLIGLNAASPYPFGWASLIAPVLMYGALRYGSAPLLEAHMLRSRGEAYRAYQARVSAFFPAPPK